MNLSLSRFSITLKRGVNKKIVGGEENRWLSFFLACVLKREIIEENSKNFIPKGEKQNEKLKEREGGKKRDFF